MKAHGCLDFCCQFIVNSLCFVHYNLSFEVLHDVYWHEGAMRRF